MIKDKRDMVIGGRAAAARRPGMSFSKISVARWLQASPNHVVIMRVTAFPIYFLSSGVATGSVGALLPSVTGFGGAGGIRGICPDGSGLVAWEAGGCRVGGRQQWVAVSVRSRATE